MSSAYTESPSDSTKSHSSHRHVGEGALDDSDSSESDDAHSRSRERRESESNSDEESGLRPLISPYQTTKIMLPTPSPLSHIAGQQQWTEDEDDGRGDIDQASPSPGSTDTESNTSEDGSSQQRGISSRTKRCSRTKSRSRSSTVASLAASSLLHIRKPLVKQMSQSSIQTVLAGDASVAGQDPREETIMDLRNNKVVSPDSRRRQQTRTLSSEYAPETESGEPEEPIPSEPVGQISDARKARILAEEARFREIGWDALREAMKQFADEGDVQMCTMLSVIAPNELRVKKRRLAHFLESYIGSIHHCGCMVYC